MARKRPGSAVADPQPPIVPAVTTPTPSPINAADLENEIEVQGFDLSDLFGDGSAPVIVELYRDRPKYVGDVKVHGYLEQLPPGAGMQYIKDLYGGGLFRVQQKPASGGAVQKQRYFDIAGPSLLPPALAAAVPTTPVVSESPTAAPAAVGTVEGVPITGNLARDMEVAKSFMLMKKALGGDDLNTQLLSLLLQERKQQAAPDLVETLKGIGPILSTLKELVPGAGDGGDGGGTNFNDIIKEALHTFGEYLKTARQLPPRAAVAPAPVPLRVPVQQLERQPAQIVENAEMTVEQPENLPAESDEPMNLTPQAMIDSAVQSIVQSYRLGKPADRVISFLNSRVPLSVELRKQYLASRRQELFDTAEMLMDQEIDGYADDAEGRAKFEAFFYEVFDQFLGGGAV
jgi:hypothetical protein